MSFAPPTESELKQLDSSFAPPSAEELSRLQSPSPFAPPSKEQISQAEAALKGLQQGATFGFSDELSGGIDALLKIGGDWLLPEGTVNPYEKQSLTEVYEKARDEERRKLEAARSQHGGTTLAGEVVGGLLIPGGMMAKAKNWKQAATAGAALGAAEGAVAGAGYSEDPDNLHQDILIGLGLGGTLGGTLGGAIGRFAEGFGSGLKEVKDTVMKDTVSPTLIIRADRMARDAADSNQQLAQMFTASDFNPSKIVNSSDEPEIRDQLIKFMRYHTDREVNSMDDLMGEFAAAQRKGQVTPESFDNFKMGEYLMEAMDQDDKARHVFYTKGTGEAENASDIVADSINKYDKKDPLRGIRKYVMDAQVAARQIDDATGLDVELLQNKLYEQTNRKKGFDREIASVHKAARKARKNNPMTDEELLEALESGNTSNPTVQAYRDTLDYLLERSREIGLNVKKRQNYVPMKKKSGIDMIVSLEKAADKLGVMTNPNNVVLKSVLSDLRKAPTEDAAIKYMDNLKGSKRDLAYLVQYLKKHFNQEITTGRELKAAVKALRSSDSLQKTLDPEVSALFERRGALPDWMREKNLDKLIYMNTDQASNAGFIQPVAEALDSRVAVLERKGMEEAADWLKKYRMDVSGIRRKKGSVDSLSNKLKQRLSLMGEDMDSDMLRYAPALMDTVASSIYPNLLGLNVRTVARNLTQPLAMTMADMGVKDSGGMVAKAYGSLMRDVAKEGWSSVRNKAVKRGLIPEEVGLGDFEGVTNGMGQYVKSKKIQASADLIEKYSNFAMWGFNKSDEINRLVTAKVADQITDRILKGDHKWFNKLPKSVSNKMKDILETPALTPQTKEQAVREMMSKWLVTSSQLVYGKVGAHQLGRDWGSALSMMSKWPVAITSDIYDKALRKEYVRLMSKYLGPVLTVTLLSRAWADKQDMSPRERALLGGGGLPNWLPITSVLGATDIAVPLNVSTGLQLGKQAFGYGTKAGMGRNTEQDDRKIREAVKRTAIQYTPIFGGMLKAYDNNVRDIIFNEGKK